MSKSKRTTTIKRPSIRESIARLEDRIKENKRVFALFIVLRGLVIFALVRSVIQARYESAFVCVLALIMLFVPSYLEESFKLDIPPLFQIIIYLFIYAAEILGEVDHFYVHIPQWDTMLHTMNGFLAGVVGFSTVYLLNRDDKVDLRLSPAYLCMVAFCFSMTIGVLWEFVEATGDAFFGQDMQKDTIVANFQSVTLDPEQDQNIVVVHDIDRTTIHTASGEEYVVDGYLDIGLQDTMGDLFVNLVGAAACSTIGYLAIKGSQKHTVQDSKLLSGLLVRPSARDKPVENL
ncbi:MAG: hypothetical protein U0L51_05795 [Olegusella sp.]|nr:hypothetical protein [Olegusella sp.]